MATFLFQLWNALVAFDMNVAGLLLGFVGAVFIALFGLPSIGVLNQGMYVEIEVTPKMRIYMWLSRFGLVMLVAGFLFQLVPAVRHS